MVEFGFNTRKENITYDSCQWLAILHFNYRDLVILKYMYKFVENKHIYYLIKAQIIFNIQR